MRVNINVKNADKVVSRLRQIGEKVVKGARYRMYKASERIMEEAKINVPRDKYRLEDAIHIEKGYGYRGRLQLDVVVSGTIDGVNVEQYAAIIHENYEDIISPDNTSVHKRTGYVQELRQGTREKQAQYPDHYIGGKFLERAAEKERKTLMEYMTAVINSAVEK